MIEQKAKDLHDKVIDTIEFIKRLYRKNGGYEDPIEVFNWGNCGNLCTFLLEEFLEQSIPCGIYLDGSQLQHVITKIGDKYYDITGEVTVKSYVSYLISVPFKVSQMANIPRDINRYSIREVCKKQVEEYSDNYNAPIVMLNGKYPKKLPSSELRIMKKIEKDLQRRRGIEIEELEGTER